VNGTLDVFDGLNITFVFFLAYEVGGAKFLTLPGLQRQILEFNLQITENVFDWLQRRQIRFTFASSSLSADNSTYGFVKRLGENKTRALAHLGHVFRIWNAYGFEFPGPKSHAIPDFVFQCLARGKIQMLTDGKELRQFTHVNDMSDALIAIMEYFEEAPHDIDVTDGNWLKLADVAKTVQDNVPGCSLNMSRRPAKVQKRHEANLTSHWHQTRWQQKLPFSDGVGEIVERMKDFINFSNSEPAVSIVIDCGPEINSSILSSLEYVTHQIDDLQKPLAPMKIEIIAAARSITTRRGLPCSVLVNPGHYRRKAVRAARSKTVLIMDYQTLPTMTQLSFFQRQIPRDLIFYFAAKVRVSAKELAHGETNATLATFAMVTDCDKKYPAPSDLSFLAATRETWMSIKVPPDDVNVNDWLMRFTPGYIAIRFESPVWTWGPKRTAVPRNKTSCCRGEVHTAKIKSGESVVYPGSRPRIR
jgi:hypothetical protein